VYKLQFLTFIFAILLPVLSRHILSFCTWKHGGGMRNLLKQ